jgi:hypothetical protein
VVENRHFDGVVVRHDRCWPVSTQLKVFPPNELGALVFPGQFKVCGGAFTIRPLVAGTTGGG